MNEIYTWLRDILIIIISLNYFQILIPDSTMAKYLQYIFCIVILAVILEPVIQLLSQS